MPILKAMICAQDVVIDARTKNVSIFNVLEGIRTATYPFTTPRIVIFSLWERQEGESAKQKCELRFRIGSTELPKIPDIELDFQDKPRTRLMLEIQGIVVPNPGSLVFTLVCGDKEMGSYEVMFEQDVSLASPRVEAKYK